MDLQDHLAALQFPRHESPQSSGRLEAMLLGPSNGLHSTSNLDKMSNSRNKGHTPIIHPASRALLDFVDVLDQEGEEFLSLTKAQLKRIERKPV